LRFPLAFFVVDLSAALVLPIAVALAHVPPLAFGRAVLGQELADAGKGHDGQKADQAAAAASCRNELAEPIEL